MLQSLEPIKVCWWKSITNSSSSGTRMGAMIEHKTIAESFEMCLIGQINGVIQHDSVFFHECI